MYCLVFRMRWPTLWLLWGSNLTKWPGSRMSASPATPCWTEEKSSCRQEWSVMLHVKNYSSQNVNHSDSLNAIVLITRARSVRDLTWIFRWRSWRRRIVSQTLYRLYDWFLLGCDYSRNRKVTCDQSNETRGLYSDLRLLREEEDTIVREKKIFAISGRISPICAW